MTTSLTADREAPSRVSAAETARGTAADIAATILVALSLTVLLEVLRVLMPVEWAKEPDLGLAVAVATYPLLFLVPLLAAPLRRIPPRTLLAVAVAAIAAGRLVLDVAPPTLALVVAVAAVALVALVPVVTIALAGERGAAVVAFGVIAGLAIDATVRGASATWDRVWRPGPWPDVITLALAAALVAALLIVLRSGPVACTEPTRGQGRTIAIIGMLLVGNVLFLQSPGYVASAAGISLGWAVAVVVGGASVASVAAALMFRRPSRVAGAVTGTLLAGVVLLCPVATGADVPFLVIAGQTLSAALVAAALATVAAPRVESMRRTAGGLAAGLLTSFVVLVLYQLHYENPLPFSNVLLVPAVVLVATLLLVLPARGGRRTEPVAVPRRPVMALALAALVAAGVTGAAVGVTAASPTVPSAAQWPLRVMTLNIGMGVSPDGRVDLGAIAAEIRRSRADVVVLEEVSRGWPLGGTQDVAGWLQHELGWQQVWAPAADRLFGNLLLSRVRLQESEALALPQAGGSMKRSAALAHVNVAGTSVLVVGTHLQHRNSAASMRARQDELRVLLDAWGGDRAAVLLGDLNPRNPDLADLATLTAAGFTTRQGTTRCTTPTSNDNCSDYVFVAPGLAQTAPVEVVDTTVWDHRPVIATVSRAK